MENSAYPEDISCKMFDFLCDVVGSAKMVKKRRLYFKIMEDVMSNSESTTIISGSKAEGLNMEGSDLDIMYVFTKIPIYNCKSHIDNVFGLITDTEDAAPGFALLKLPHGNFPYPSFQYSCSKYGLLLSSSEVKQKALQVMENDARRGNWFKIHGPCISSLDDMNDTAVCLKSETWPFVCMKWFYRTRYSKWPTSNDVENIAKEGILYVPIGSKYGSKNENSLEWRISFSVQEKILVHSFNQAQLICYALLKIVLKEVINTNRHINNLLCSYFMKTVVFWLAEESDPLSWNRETLLTCFQSCLDRLIYWVTIGYCPNYFIAENNMFEGKIVGEGKRNLLDFLTILRKEGVKLTIRSVTLSKFFSYDHLRYKMHDGEEEDKAIYPLLYNYLCAKDNQNNTKILRRLNGHLINKDQLTKSLYLLWLMNYYIGKVEAAPYKFHASNKVLYRFYKLFLSYCLIAKNIDVVSGGALLATFFYKHKEYEKSLTVTNYALQECSPYKYYVHRFNSSNLEGNDITNSNMSFLQRHKLSCIYGILILPCRQSVLHIQDLNVGIPVENGEIMGPTNVIIHYLRFMCFHHLENYVEKHRCLEDMKLAIEEGFLINHCTILSLGTLYLFKAAQIANCLGEFSHLAVKVNMEILTQLLSDG